MSETTEIGLDARLAQIDAQVDQLNAKYRELTEQSDEVRAALRKLEAEKIELTVPYRVGDIIEDEKKVHYRVTHVGYRSGSSPLNLVGIRLTKEGHEAHKDPRPIYSAKVKKVN